MKRRIISSDEAKSIRSDRDAGKGPGYKPWNEGPQDYVTIEEVSDYEQIEPDNAIRVWNYYVTNPNGEADGYVEVSEFSDGAFQIEEIHNAPMVEDNALDRLIGGAANEEFTDDGIEGYLNKIFKKYVNMYFDNSANSSTVVGSDEGSDAFDIESTNEAIGDTLNRFFRTAPCQIALEYIEDDLFISVYDPEWNELYYQEKTYVNELPAELRGYREFVESILERADIPL